MGTIHTVLAVCLIEVSEGKDEEYRGSTKANILICSLVDTVEETKNSLVVGRIFSVLIMAVYVEGYGDEERFMASEDITFSSGYSL